MTKRALLFFAVLCACGKSADKAEPPQEAPSLSAAGDVKVPPGHETTYVLDGTPTRLEYTWIDIESVEGKPAFRILAQGGPHHGLFTMIVPISDATTKRLDQLVGIELGALPNGISFGNAPVMATGTGGTVKLTEVTPDHVSGTFDAQACEGGQRTCAKPMHAQDGKFKAFRSALADDATFTRTMSTPAP